MLKSIFGDMKFGGRKCWKLSKTSRIHPLALFPSQFIPVTYFHFWKLVSSSVCTLPLHTRSGLGLVHIVRFFSDCDCDSSYHNRWFVQDSMEVFTLCDCDNITYLAHFKQKQIAVAIRNKRTV